jgi:parallel beta-helix repeat protein
MSRNGSGVYTVPAADNPAVSGQVISSSHYNNTNSDLATALTESIARDGQTTVTANLPMNTKRHTGVGDGVGRTDYASLGQVQDGAGQWAGTAGGTANAITLTLSPAETAYAAGQKFNFKALATNTSSATITVNALTAKAAQVFGNALLGGEIIINQWYSALYDGSAFQISPISFNMPWVDVRMFGVIMGDGLIDNVSNLQSAADAAVGGTLFIPPGTITLKSRIIIPANTWVKGSGMGVSTIKAISTFTSEQLILMSYSNSTLSDMTIDGNNQAPLVENVQINNSNNNVVTHIESKNGQRLIEVLGDSVGAYYNRVTDNYLHDGFGNINVGVLLFAGVHNTIISGNILKNMSASSNSYFILIDGGTSGGSSNPCTDNMVENNVVTGTGTFGISVEGSHRNIVQNNHVYLSSGSLGLSTYRDNTAPSVLPENNVFSNNFVRGGNIGMEVDGSGTVVQGNGFYDFLLQGIYVTYVGGVNGDNTKISGNIFDSSASNVIGIDYNEGQHFEIIGNTFRNMTTGIQSIAGAVGMVIIKNNALFDTVLKAIAITGSQTDLIIENNLIFNAGDSIHAAIDLVATSATIDRVSIKNNIYSDDRVSPTTSSFIYVHGSPTNLAADGNISLRSIVPTYEGGPMPGTLGFISGAATGTAPLSLISTTKVANLIVEGVGIQSSSGTPAGTPVGGGMIFDTANFKLWAYTGTTWKFIQLA